MENNETLKDKIISHLKEVYDPEMPVNIYDLGLVYEINIEENNFVKIKMTLTSPNCPMAEEIPIQVKNKVKEIGEISDVFVDIVFEPPWDPATISEAGKLELGLL